MFYGLGADGTVGANKNSIKIIGEDTDNFAQGYFVYDSKKSGSVTMSHLRFGPKPIRSTYLITQRQLRGLPPVQLPGAARRAEVRRAGRDVPAEQPLRPGRGLGQAAAHGAEADHRQEAEVLRHRRATKWRKAAGMGGRINTIMQTCFFAISGVLPREEAIAQHQEGHREDLRQARRSGRAEELCRRGRGPRATCTKSRCPATVTSTFELRPPVPAEAPEFVQERARPDHRRRRRLPAGQRDARRRHLPHRHRAVGEAQHRARNSGLGRAALHPVRQVRAWSARTPCIRAKVYDPASTASAPPDASSRLHAKWKEFSDSKYTLQVAPEDCTGCGLCVESARPRTRAKPSTRPSTWQPQPPLREHEAQNWDFFLVASRDRPRPDLASARSRTRNCCEPLFEFSGACAGCGETPYIKLMTQLFGDRALDRQRHRLLLDLRRQPADHALHVERRRPRPGLVELAVRRQRRVRPGHAADRRQAERVRQRAGAAVWQREIGDELAAAILDADQSTEAGIYAAARAGDAAEGRSWQGASTPPTPATCWRWPTRWSRRASGSSAATAGPTTSATAAWTTCWPPAATSTSWCSTPRSTPTPAARCRRRRRAARWPSSPPAASRAPRRTWRMMAMTYGNVYVAHVAMGANDAQTIKAFIEAELRRPVAHHRLQPLHRARLRPGARPRAAEAGGAVRPLAAVPLQPGAGGEGKNPFQLDSQRAQPCRWRSTSTTRPATPCWCTAIRTRPRSC